MTQVILAIHLMVVIALIIVILYQKSEGGALGMGGQGGVFTGRGQANALTRATGILATAFFLTSIALTVIPAWQRRVEGGGDWTKAINQGDIKLKEIKPGDKSAPAAPEAGKDSIFDQLQRAQQQRQQQAPATAPASPPPPAAEAPRVEPPKVEPSRVEPPRVEPPKVEAPRPVEPKAEAPKPAAPDAAAPVAQPAAPATQPAAPAAPPPVKWTAPTR